MARKRTYIEDVAYGEEHRHRLPELYNRIGHRLDMADRDFTEFCHHCKQPLAIIELVRDTGRNLLEKGVSVTTKLAKETSLHAYCVAYTLNRPPEVQKRIKELGDELMRLMTKYPISMFKVRSLNPVGRSFSTVAPDDYWRFIFSIHRNHHKTCASAIANNERPVNGHALYKELERSGLLIPIQVRLPLGD